MNDTVKVEVDWERINQKLADELQKEREPRPAGPDKAAAKPARH